jgi:hypothetical protein
VAGAWEVLFLDSSMPQPTFPSGSTPKQFQLRERFQRYVTREDQMNADMMAKLADGKVVIVQPPRGSRVDKEVRDIPGIIKPGVYQFRATNADPSSRIIMFRRTSCWCSSCIKADYDNCLTNSEWQTIDLKQVQQQQQSPVAMDT